MESDKRSAWDKARKVWRYCRLYGPARTWGKVHGYWHQRRRFEPLPPCAPPKPGHRVALIGCGNYAYTNIAWYLRKNFGDVIGGCMDIDPHRAASLARYYKAPFHTTDAEALLNQSSLSLVYVASNHASHADYAVAALERGKDVYIEKPHVVNDDQLRRLIAAMRNSTGRIYLGFNRPKSHFGDLLRGYLAQQAGPAMMSWFVIGHHLGLDHWYNKPGEGGRVLGNVCHWSDFLYYLAPGERFPITVRATSIGGGDTDLVVTLTFGDGTVGSITFTAKGETFEGIREHLSCQRGDLIAWLDDFQKLRTEIGPTKRTHRLLFRDHGHQRNIAGAYRNAVERLPYDRDAETAYIANTAHLFLETKRAVETGEQRVVHPYDLTAATLALPTSAGRRAA